MPTPGKGQIYGLPKDWSPIGAVYDPDAFESAGVTMPTTWDEFRVASRRSKTATGRPPLALEPNFDRFVIFMYQAGGNITNADVTEITLGSAGDDPGARILLRAVRGWTLRHVGRHRRRVAG